MNDPSFHHARILIVDDQPANVSLLQRLLAQWGYDNVVTTTASTEVLGLCRRAEPDLILLDLHMPRPDGYEVLELLGQLTQVQVRPPVLVVTSDLSSDARHRALSLGARDFLTNPFDQIEVKLRVGNLLEMRRMQLELESRNEALAERVRARTQELEHARFDELDRLALAAEYRDDDTQEHARRIGRTSGLLAHRLGLGIEMRELLVWAAPLHDVGKIGIPDSILLKPARLTPAEFEVVKTHAQIGADLLSGGRSPILRLAREIALTHHERWDGTGYPNGVAGHLIPIAGRIVSVADVFDALTHSRPYKEAWPIERAVHEITDGSGHQFDTAVVQAFRSLDHQALVTPIASPHPRPIRTGVVPTRPG